MEQEGDGCSLSPAISAVDQFAPPAPDIRQALLGRRWIGVIRRKMVPVVAIFLRLAVVLVAANIFSAIGTAGRDGITGRARVIDGDTIVIRGHRIRLFRIDAREAEQLYSIRGKSYHCWR